MSAESPVVEAMKQQAAATWRAWREHVKNDTATSPEALELWEEARLAARVLLDERTDRAQLEAKHDQARAA